MHQEIKNEITRGSVFIVFVKNTQPFQNLIELRQVKKIMIKLCINYDFILIKYTIVSVHLILIIHM